MRDENMKLIESSKLSQSLNIKEDTLYRIFGICGFKRKKSYTLNQVRFVVDNLPCDNYRKKVIVNKLDDIVSYLSDLQST